MTRLAIVLVLGLVSAAAAQSPAAPALRPAAQAGIAKAMVAVQAQDWKLAATYFLEALDNIYFTIGESAPPELLRNLGLAHAKAGNELAAMAWFQAYLASSPQAADSPEVSLEIARLDAAAVVEVRKGFDVAVEHVAAYPHLASNVAYELAMAGDVERAMDVLAEHDAEDERDYAWEGYALYLEMTGDVNRARDAMAKVSESRRREVTGSRTFVAKPLGDDSILETLMSDAKGKSTWGPAADLGRVLSRGIADKTVDRRSIAAPPRWLNDELIKRRAWQKLLAARSSPSGS